MIGVFINNEVDKKSLKRLLDKTLGDKISWFESIEAFSNAEMDIIITDQTNNIKSNAPVISFNTDGPSGIALPCRPSDLLFKINALLSAKSTAQETTISLGVYQFFPFEFLLKKEDLTEIILTEKERDILLFLHKSKVQVSRDDLLQAVWGYGDAIETHTLETHIYRLRQKIETDPSTPQFLMTDDVGYYLHPNL